MSRRTVGGIKAIAGLSVILYGGQAMASVIHGQIDVVQNDALNNATSVTVTVPVASPGFGVAPGSNRGDINIATSLTNSAGVLLTSVRENGRNNDPAGGGRIGGVDNQPFGGTRYATSAVDFDGSAWFIPTFNTSANATTVGAAAAPGGEEFNVNVAAAYFPYSAGYLGGLIRNSTGANGGNNDQLATAHPSLVLGTHIIDRNQDPTPLGGRTTIDLTSLTATGKNGPVAATSANGVLLVNHGKNEDNFALSLANADGTFTAFVKDNGSDGANYEQDPLSFVYVPIDDPNAVAVGRVDNEGDAMIGTGNFTVTRPATGRWLLKIAGQTNDLGTLIVSAEGGNGNNVDNVVSYQWDETEQGWFIESRDLPNMGLQNGSADAAVFSFAFFAIPEPGTVGLLLPAALSLMARRRHRRE